LWSIFKLKLFLTPLLEFLLDFEYISISIS
jgi:hypothetical protein